MPEAEYVWLPREDILSFEEISTLTDLFTTVGVNKVRLTGGEPLLRKNLPDLIKVLAAKPAIQDLALTTNGILLADRAATLHSAGLQRITVSLDTLKPDRFKALTHGPWTCPTCGPLRKRLQPLYGEDERHHCPNLDCDAVVTLLSKEELEPPERRGSWPPQRNKNREKT